MARADRCLGIQSPCKGCADRYGNCHAVCERYKEYRAKVDAAREKRAEACFEATVTIERMDRHVRRK